MLNLGKMDAGGEAMATSTKIVTKRLGISIALPRSPALKATALILIAFFITMVALASAVIWSAIENLIAR
jgi:hypothetical protein